MFNLFISREHTFIYMHHSLFVILFFSWSDHYTNASSLPDATLAEASNFCRATSSVNAPWCFTDNPNVDWELCDVEYCCRLICRNKYKSTSIIGPLRGAKTVYCLFAGLHFIIGIDCVLIERKLATLAKKIKYCDIEINARFARTHLFAR